MKSLIFIFLATLTWSCNYEENQIKNLIDELEKINSEILNTISNHDSQTILDLLKKSDNQDIKSKTHELISHYELCEVKLYNKRGITYLFKCKNNSRDKFIDADEEYYLIKIIDRKYQDKFLNYEQFIDYQTELVALKNDWYFIRKDIFFD